MEKLPNKKHLVFWIVFPISMIIITVLLTFIFDLTNGPLILFVLMMAGIAAFISLRIYLLNKKFLPRLISWLGFISYTITMLAFSKPAGIVPVGTFLPPAISSSSSSDNSFPGVIAPASLSSS